MAKPYSSLISLTELSARCIIEYNLNISNIPLIVKRQVINIYKVTKNNIFRFIECDKNNDLLLSIIKSKNKVYIPYKCQSILQQKEYKGKEYISFTDLTKNQLVNVLRKTKKLKI